MKIDIPPAPLAYESEYFIRAFSAIGRMFGVAVATNEAVDAVLLRSPNGSVFKLSLDNTGAVVTTSIPLGQTGAPNY